VQFFAGAIANLKIFYATLAPLVGSNRLGPGSVELCVLEAGLLDQFDHYMSDLRTLRLGAYTCRVYSHGVYNHGPGRPPMLAARRFCLLLVLGTLFAASLSLPLLAQVQGVPAMEFHGVPPSGIGGTTAGFSAVRPNANGPAAAFGCCANFFFPSSFSPIVPYPSVVTGPREHRRHHRRGDESVGVVEPVYVPYAVPYAADSDDAADDQDDAGMAARDGGGAPERPSAYRGGKSGRRRFGANGGPENPEQQAGGDADSVYAADADSATQTAPVAPEEPVVAQPTTVLVFKDGHRSEIVNYAIVGDALFDFTGDRTHRILLADLDIPATQKANEASGVEFKLPPAGEASSTRKSGAN
jgi:hypothetical protein